MDYTWQGLNHHFDTLLELHHSLSFQSSPGFKCMKARSLRINFCAKTWVRVFLHRVSDIWGKKTCENLRTSAQRKYMHFMTVLLYLQWELIIRCIYELCQLSLFSLFSQKEKVWFGATNELCQTWCSRRLYLSSMLLLMDALELLESSAYWL